MKAINYIFSFVLALAMFSCAAKQRSDQEPGQDKKGKIQPSSLTVEPDAFSAAEKAKLDTATFAAGCFWCTEAVFERVKGVKSVISGYAGGTEPNPSYEKVSSGTTNYAESVEVYYDPQEVTYQTLLKVFFADHDPTQLNRQGPDVGKQYRSAIFYHNQQQKQEAEAYIQKLTKEGTYDKPIVTQVNPYDKFYEAEDYHQNYYEHNPGNPYIINVTKPKVENFEKHFKELLKPGVSS